MAMIAVAFMACGDKNGANLPSKDKAAINEVTVEAVAMIGDDAASVDKALLAAGYTKADISMMSAPKRIQRKFQAPAAKEEEQAYVYGIDPKYLTEEEEDAAAFNKALKNGSIIIVYVMYVGDKLYAIESVTMAQCAKGASRLYTDISDGLYKQIPADAADKYWSGASEKKSYTKQEEFVADITAAEDGIVAQEQGYAITGVSAAGYEGFFYQGAWADPDAETKEYMEEEGNLPYAVAAVAVADVNALQNALQQ